MGAFGEGLFKELFFPEFLLWELDLVRGDLVVHAGDVHALLRVPAEVPITQDLLLSLVHPDDLGRVLGRIERGIEAGVNVDVEYRMVLSDGTYLHRTRMRIERGADGQSGRCLGHSEDVTLLRQGEASLDGERWFRSFAEVASGAMLVTDLDGTIAYANALACRALDRSRAALIGAPLSAVFAPASSAQLTRRLDRALRGVVESIELTLTTATDRSLHVLVATSPLHDRQGTITRVVLALTDVGHVDRHERSLRDARDEALRASQAQSTFLARMSHEMRTPLHAVLGFGELLEQRDDLSSEARDHLTRLLTGARHLRALIEDALTLQRADQGRLGIEWRPVELGGLLKKVAAARARSATSRGARLELSVADEPLVLRGDEKRLGQALDNIVATALRLSPGATTTLCAQRMGPALRVDVRFRGRLGGDLERLFDPFEPLGAEHKTVGTGLELVLARRLVEAMDGQVVARATAGEGASFSVFLPVIDTTPVGLSLTVAAEGAVEAGLAQALVDYDGRAVAQALARERARLGRWERVADALYNTITELRAQRARGDLGAQLRLAALQAGIVDAIEATPPKSARRCALASLGGHDHPTETSLAELVAREVGFDTSWLDGNASAATLRQRLGEIEAELLVLVGAEDVLEGHVEPLREALAGAQVPLVLASPSAAGAAFGGLSKALAARFDHAPREGGALAPSAELEKGAPDA
jgi:PAS domain S-box-containing protein